MAWRPNRYLIGGQLDNTVAGRVTGWLEFIGLSERVMLDLNGDFHRDVRGATLVIARAPGVDDAQAAAAYFNGFSQRQAGAAGDMTAGRHPYDFADYPYLEWYSTANGRVVLELERDEVTVLGTPLDWRHQDPISRALQARHMSQFLTGMCNAFATATNGHKH